MTYDDDLKKPISRGLQMVLFLVFGFVTIWDTFTTVIGIASVIGYANMQIAIAVIFSVLISGFLMATVPILQNNDGDAIDYGGKFLWFLALAYDLYTACRGNIDFIVNAGNNQMGVHQWIIAAGITIFVCASPIVISYLFHKTKAR